MREHSRFCCAFRKAGQLTASVAVRSWTLQEPQIERREHQDNSDVHHQPLPEPVPEEQDVHADHDGHHREHVDYDGCLSSHPSHLIRATKRRQTAWLPRPLAPKTGHREHRWHIYDQICRYQWVAVEINAALFRTSSQTAMIQNYVKVIRECQKFRKQSIVKRKRK